MRIGHILHSSFFAESYCNVMVKIFLIYCSFLALLMMKQGNKSFIRDSDAVLSNTQTSNSLSSSYFTGNGATLPGNTGSPSANGSLISSYDEAESEDIHQAVSRLPVFPGYGFQDGHIGGYERNQLQIPSLDYSSHAHKESISQDAIQPVTLDLATWQEVFEQCGTVSSAGVSHNVPNLIGNSEVIDYCNGNLNELLDGAAIVNSGFEGLQFETNWQNNILLELSSTEIEGDPCGEEISDNTNFTARHQYFGNLSKEEGLQKMDSFSKWITKELANDEDLHLEPSSSIPWCNIENGNADDDSSITNQLQLDNYSMNPSISQDQLFSIVEFSPSWSYADHETKVLITGQFLKSQQEIAKCNWSCMFGEVEVPAEILGDGIIQCLAPPLAVGQVPFYVTCSNRLACSEVREFDYRDSQNVDTAEMQGDISEQHLHSRLEMLLSLRSVGDGSPPADDVNGKWEKISKIAILKDDTLCKPSDNSWAIKSLKERLFSWLYEKASEDGKGPNVLDTGGQGVLHLAAALGYDWIIQPTLAAGVKINFRDVNGWTALHWAAFCGRETTVPLLILLGAAPGALTDPSPEVPWGRTPYDLASANGYKGISGFLAESSLTSHLASLSMNEPKVDGQVEGSIVKAVQTISERTATPGFEGDASDVLSLKDSLAAVCNATQAAGRIHEVFRMQSFQRKQQSGCSADKAGLTDECILSVTSRKMQKNGPDDEKVHSAAVSIQKKYRGWKMRKEFLVIRQRVVKIQAHVRGHQVRKRYRTVVWSVGILEKVILRWRRKGTGLRGFRPDAAQINTEIPPEDDYDYLKEGRKKTEERLHKALVRVNSMVQYPEGRAQYRRLLTAVEDFQKNQQVCNSIMSSSEGTSVYGDYDMFDVDQLLDDDTFMALAFK